MMQHPGPTAVGAVTTSCGSKSRGPLPELSRMERAARLTGAVAFNRGRGQMPHNRLLPVPPCPLPIGVSCWPSPTRSQRASDQPSRYREGLEFRGQKKNVQSRVKGCDFFFPKDFNKCCEFACQKCSNFLTPHW